MKQIHIRGGSVSHVDAQPGTFYVVDTSAGEVEIVLPPIHAQGDEIAIKHKRGSNELSILSVNAIDSVYVLNSVVPGTFWHVVSDSEEWMVA